MEEQLLLRVPGELGDRIRTMLRGQSTHALSFKFDDERRATLTMDGHGYTAALVDLPCIIETHKTFDNSSFYKSADLSQLLMVQPSSSASISSSTTSSTSSSSSSSSSSGSGSGVGALTTGVHQVDKVWPPPARYPHGVTPYAYNIRPKRFERAEPPSVYHCCVMLCYAAMHECSHM
jgi:TATA-binding protein-associated factor Taf7